MAEIALKTASGFIGRLVRRTPTASSIALAIGRRDAERAGLAHALGAERAAPLLRHHRLVHDLGGKVEQPRDLVFRERGVAQLPAVVELHLFETG
jgi:hypothetical protein